MLLIIIRISRVLFTRCLGVSGALEDSRKHTTRMGSLTQIRAEFGRVVSLHCCGDLDSTADVTGMDNFLTTQHTVRVSRSNFSGHTLRPCHRLSGSLFGFSLLRYFRRMFLLYILRLLDYLFRALLSVFDFI